jgi:hypothetical protein
MASKRADEGTLPWSIVTASGLAFSPLAGQDSSAPTFASGGPRRIATSFALTNFYMGTTESIARLLGDLRIELLRQEVTLPLYLEFDGIYNLACPTALIKYQFDPGRQPTPACAA